MDITVILPSSKRYLAAIQMRIYPKTCQTRKQRDLSLQVSAGQDREQIHLLNKGWRQHQFTIKPKLGTATSKLVLPFILLSNKI